MRSTPSQRVSYAVECRDIGVVMEKGSSLSDTHDQIPTSLIWFLMTENECYKSARKVNHTTWESL